MATLLPLCCRGFPFQPLGTLLGCYLSGLPPVMYVGAGSFISDVTFSVTYAYVMIMAICNNRLLCICDSYWCDGHQFITDRLCFVIL